LKIGRILFIFLVDSSLVCCILGSAGTSIVGTNRLVFLAILLFVISILSFTVFAGTGLRFSSLLSVFFGRLVGIFSLSSLLFLAVFFRIICKKM
jgi:hypothetical protein